MQDIRRVITEQLRQLQMLTQKSQFKGFMGAEQRTTYRGQGRVLAILKMKPEISQKELNYLLDMSKQALSELLVKLEKRGFITREPSEEDKRVMMICLTEKGAKAAESSTDPSDESMEMFDCLSEEELEQFSAYLGRIITRYIEMYPNDEYDKRQERIHDFVDRQMRDLGIEESLNDIRDIFGAFGFGPDNRRK